MPASLAQIRALRLGVFCAPLLGLTGGCDRAASEDELPASAAVQSPAHDSQQRGKSNGEEDIQFLATRFRTPQKPVTKLFIRPRFEVAERLRPTDLVLGITLGGESRAYPIKLLNVISQKVVNDELGGTSIAITWCDLCHSGLVYSRYAGGRELTLAVDGRLWNDNMIMFDAETRSSWSQLLGMAIQGRLKGTAMKRLPSVLMDWQSWQSRHPDGTVAWPGGPQAPSVAEFTTPPEAELVSGELATARLYDRTVRSKTLTFRLTEGFMVDEQTNTQWDPQTGQAIAGPWRGESLVPLPATVLYRKPWLAFYPGSIAGQAL